MRASETITCVRVTCSPASVSFQRAGAAQLSVVSALQIALPSVELEKPLELPRGEQRHVDHVRGIRCGDTDPWLGIRRSADPAVLTTGLDEAEPQPTRRLEEADEHRSGKSNRRIRVRKKLCHYVAGPRWTCTLTTNRLGAWPPTRYIIENNPYFLSPRISALREIRAKLDPYPDARRQLYRPLLGGSWFFAAPLR